MEESLIEDSAYRNLLFQYFAECLPKDVTNILFDYFVNNNDSNRNDNVLASTSTACRSTSFLLDESLKVNLIEEQQNHTDLQNKEIYENTENSNRVSFAAELNLKSITNILDDIPTDLIECDSFYEEYFKHGCGCSRNCHKIFSRRVALRAHLDALGLDQYCASHINHQHLLLLGAMNALVKNQPISKSRKSNSTKDRINARTFFKFRGQDVCRKFFMYVFGCGEKRIKNVMKQFLTNGVFAKQHESASLIKNLVKVDVNKQRRDALIFIVTYSQQNALQLPGRYVKAANVFEDLYILPNQTNLNRRYVFEQYVAACNEQRSEPISFALWNELWDLKFPNIITYNNHKEICVDCRNYQLFNTTVLSSGKYLNNNESDKLLNAQRYLAHLNFVQSEIAFYRDILEKCRLDYELILKKTDLDSTLPQNFVSSLSSMHYTFDWYSTISLPYTSKNPTYYFKQGYKIALFGISVEPIKKFVLYIVPEYICNKSENIMNITISLIHNFFKNYIFNEKEAVIHFANSSTNQAKNSLIFSYFMWRTLLGYHDKVSISYLPSGHTRCWNDLFMGVFKKKIRNCQVNSLSDIKLIAERCTMNDLGDELFSESDSKMNLVHPMLVANDNEEILVPMYDWQTKLALIQQLNNSVIVENNHFEINIEIPGFILCRKSINSEIISYKLLSNENLPLIDQQLPNQLSFDSLPSERIQYLYREIKKYFPKDCLKSMNIFSKSLKNNCEENWSSCSSNQLVSKRNIVSNSDIQNKKHTKSALESPKGKKLSPPTCSYCKNVGHRESIFGKIRCPLKKKDSFLLQNAEVVVQEAEDSYNYEHELEVDTSIDADNIFESEQQLEPMIQKEFMDFDSDDYQTNNQTEQYELIIEDSSEIDNDSANMENQAISFICDEIDTKHSNE